MSEMHPECLLCRTKERSPEEIHKLVNRLNRAEGQIRGIRSMVENNAYCTDILMQAAAARAALDSFCRELLLEHIRTCVKDDILAGREETIDELMEMLQKFIK